MKSATRVQPAHCGHTTVAIHPDLTQDLKCSHIILCNSSMARVATTMGAFNAVAETWRLYWLSALAPEPIHDRAKGYKCFERWDDVPRPDVGGA